MLTIYKSVGAVIIFSVAIVISESMFKCAENVNRCRGKPVVASTTLVELTILVLKLFQ